MLHVLLAKDLRRAGRNPLPWIINLIVPLAMTALIGLVFGGKAENGALGRIRFAVVNEDKPFLSDFLRGAANQGQDNKYLDPVFMQRDEALKLVNANKISAVLIIETNFVRNYLTAREPVTLTLIKNPAEAIHPAVLEELTGAMVTALNAISRNFNAEFPAWERVFEGKDDYHRVAFLIDQAGDKLKAARQFIDPPLVGYKKDEPSSEHDTNQAATTAGTKGSKSGNDGLSGLFAYLLIGMSAMFLLFLGQNAMTDLHRELRQRTFARYQTLHQDVWPFLLSKVVFAVVTLLICSAVMFGGGGLAFKIQWQNPIALAALAAGYSCFVAALFAVLVALVPDERRAAALNNIAGMALGLAGGCAFPPQQLPAFVREHVTPWMPSYWFAEAARNVQSGTGLHPWGEALFQLLLSAVILTAVAAWLFRRKFRIGLH